MNKNKHLSPWMTSPHINDEERMRHFIYNRANFFGVFLDSRKIKWFHFVRNEKFNTREEAMSDLDTFLIEKGYILLTQEQYDKLAILF
jgi:hypothetical protein